MQIRHEYQSVFNMVCTARLAPSIIIYRETILGPVVVRVIKTVGC